MVENTLGVSEAVFMEVLAHDDELGVALDWTASEVGRTDIHRIFLQIRDLSSHVGIKILDCLCSFIGCSINVSFHDC